MTLRNRFKFNSISQN